jgi:hypothetical protein
MNLLKVRLENGRLRPLDCSKEPKRRKAPKMTICAAAICDHCNGDAVITISDRMITSGDIEFEDNRTKIMELSPRIVCLFAGNRDFHHMIAEATKKTVTADNVTDVAETAEIYASHFVALRRRRAEQRYLAPLGLTADTFRSYQREMNENVVSSLLSNMLGEALGVQAIIAGKDASGAHICTIARADREFGEFCSPVCHDGQDYVAIGTGFRQFETQFMSLGYTRQYGSLWTLLLMLEAKRRAEVSPGVGSATDASIISDTFRVYTPEAIGTMDRYLQELEDAIRKIRQDISDKIAADPFWSSKDAPPAEPPSPG